MNAIHSTGPILPLGVQALQRALQDAQRQARKLEAATRLESRRPVEPMEEMSEAAVGLLQARQQAQAGARLIATADDLMGTLLDVRA